MDKFRDLIATLIYDYQWQWLETFINTLCVWEMKVRECAALPKLLWNSGKIPKGVYCYAEETCPYWSFSRVARFFYGEQSSGYCFKLGEGDFNSGTLILWDQCKCCGINDDEDFNKEGIVECNLEL